MTSRSKCCRRSPPNDAPKGIAEVVMIPIVPAILNAIYDATGHRFRILAGHRSHDQRSAAVTTMSLTINGKPYGPFEVRDELSMNDFLREYLELTGTKFGCGVAQCLSCAVIVDNPDGTSETSPTCIVPAVSFAGKSIRTVEGHAQNGQLSRAAKGLRRTFLVPVRLLHGRLLERGPGAAGTLGEIAGVARRAGSAPSRMRSTAIFAAAPATSNIMRPCAT